MKLRNVVLVDGVRSAFVRGGRGSLVAIRLDEASAHVLRALLERSPKVTDRMIDDIGLGNVLGAPELAGLGANNVARLAGLPAETATFDSNRQCGSSMETLHRIAQAIMVGVMDCGIAMGIERMGRSLAPGGGDKDRNRVTEFNLRRLSQNAIQRDMAPDHKQMYSVPFPDYILDAPPVMTMVQTAQNVAEVYNLSREELDAYAVESHRRSSRMRGALTRTRSSPWRSRRRYSMSRECGCPKSVVSGKSSTPTSQYAPALRWNRSANSSR